MPLLSLPISHFSQLWLKIVETVADRPEQILSSLPLFINTTYWLAGKEQSALVAHMIITFYILTCIVLKIMKNF